LILRSQLQAAPLDGTGTVGSTIIVLSLSALAEELLFRGLLHPTIKQVFGAWGLTFGAALFALSYAGLSFLAGAPTEPARSMASRLRMASCL
jgi:membrane protease YdiL (CAAX protease family)